MQDFLLSFGTTGRNAEAQALKSQITHHSKGWLVTCLLILSVADKAPVCCLFLLLALTDGYGEELCLHPPHHTHGAAKTPHPAWGRDTEALTWDFHNLRNGVSVVEIAANSPSYLFILLS